MIAPKDTNSQDEDSLSLIQEESSSNAALPTKGEEPPQTPVSILKRRTSSLQSDDSDDLESYRRAFPVRKTASFDDDNFDDEYERPLRPSITAGSDMNTSVHYRRGRRDYDFLMDTPDNMTYSRRLALYLMQYNWYYPMKTNMQSSENGDYESNDDLVSMDTASVLSFSLHKSTTFKKASLPKAWAYFDHVTLPRHIWNEKEEHNARQRRRSSCLPGDRKSLARTWKRLNHHRNVPLLRADPGEMHKYTKLYSPLWTPMAQMGDFGLGTGLYFTTLRALTVMTFILGLVNIPNMLYFSSEDYSDGQKGVSFFLKGSAICTRAAWVPCPDCRITDEWSDNMDRIANTTSTNGDLLIFALRNECDGARFELARINFVTILFLIAGLVALGSYQRRWERQFTEGKEKTHDYSIVIKNPPELASDPDEWKHYFESTFRAKVTLVTIGLNNDLLVRTLVQRREALRRLELALDPGISLDVLSLAKISSKIEHDRNSLQWLVHLFIPGIPELFARLTVLTARVQGLAQQTYQVRHVFITFEKVSTRIRILNEFALGNLAIMGWMKSATRGKQHLFFRGTPLKVRQPDEPATIRWQDLNTPLRVRVVELIFTNLIGLAGIALFAYLITITFEYNYLLGAGFIAVSNLGYAEFAKLITKLFESHFAEGDVQASIYVKVALFRFVNTAIIITIITPFTAQLEEDGLIPVVCAVFLAELITVNLARLSDPVGHFKRHILAPRARTQDAMNVNMRGTPVELAERVTDSTKMIFLTFWYSAIFPAGFFLCSLVLIVKYYTDQFGLMRTWKRVLPVGNRIANFGRRYFISTSVVAFATISSYAWSGFPYDNLCDNEGRVDTSYVGNWTLKTGETGEEVDAMVSESDSSFRYCLQNLILVSGPSFPAIPENQPLGDEWMTSDQEKIATIFGWTSVACIAFVGFTIVWKWSDAVAELFYQKTEASEKVATTKRTFHQVMDQSSISTYIPEVKSGLFPYPLVACNTDGIDDEIYTWTDADQPHSYYDLTKDAKFLTEGRVGLDMSNVFSSHKHYHPDDSILPPRQGEEDGKSDGYDSNNDFVRTNPRKEGSVTHGRNDNQNDPEYEAFLKGNENQAVGFQDYAGRLKGETPSAVKAAPLHHRRGWTINEDDADGEENAQDGFDPLRDLRKSLSQRLPTISPSARKLLNEKG
mmetsp:Transcript_9917/g.16467  ORF Transcript_9917/g.16467 Transcript_9917/m.16467 type:complete len:1175 (-) Transcript_9917:117-3641(-)